MNFLKLMALVIVSLFLGGYLGSKLPTVNKSDSRYNVGDCMILNNSDSVFKIIEIGKLDGVRAQEKFADGYDAGIVILYLKTRDKDYSVVDCFDQFDTKKALFEKVGT